ncbi:substrate-binding domain-containing protein [Nonomuraea roseoviolacea]|uniref:substrate-binding domain-containing protein n=1 Tax=Nonomuraea roseoviolacea TaxID=103837 RepID=UPI003CD08A23
MERPRSRACSPPSSAGEQPQTPRNSSVHGRQDATRLSGAPQTAEDLTSEAFLRTLRPVRAATGGPSETWRPSLYAVVRNRNRDGPVDRRWGDAHRPVVGFDGLTLGELVDPPLTTSSIDKRRLGRLAVDHVSAQLQGVAAASPRPDSVVIPELVIRTST